MDLAFLTRKPHLPDKAWHNPIKSIATRIAYVLITLFSLMFLLPSAQAETAGSIGMKLLVISADGTEPSFAAIKSTLDQIGVPYDTLIATKASTPFSAATLSDGVSAGYYQGVLLATGNLGYQTSTGDYVSAFSAAQWAALWQYEETYRVRQVTLYTYPAGAPDNYGLNIYSGVDTTSAPIAAQLTSAGQAVFPYLNASNPVTITYAWTYLATPASSTNPVTLLSTPDGLYSLASIYTYPDGRQNLTITVDSNPYLIHYMELGYGIVNWVTKGVFLGSRKVYLSPQPDDVLIDDDMWDQVAKTDASGLTFRLTGPELASLVNWQKSFRQAHPTAAQMVLEMPFNGVGAYDTADYPDDTLSLSIANNQSSFRWISHTWDHANLDTISQQDAMMELHQNNKAATNKNAFGKNNPGFVFTNYYKDSMIQPDISGLGNPTFLQAANNFGINYILSDTSQPNWTNPTPNTGFYISWVPTIATASLPPTNTASILVIPRHPTNLYYNVNTPANWVSEYNFYYGPGGAFATWPTNLNYQQVLDKESSIMLTYLLTYDIDPLMFHQPNLSNYDGIGHSLLGDLLDATVTKYETLFNLPIQTLAQHDIGVLMAQRMAYNASGMTGTLVLGATSNTIALKNGAVTNVTIPITGINYGTGASTYGGQVISSVNLGKGAALTIPGPASW